MNSQKTLRNIIFIVSTVLIIFSFDANAQKGKFGAKLKKAGSITNKLNLDSIEVYRPKKRPKGMINLLREVRTLEQHKDSLYDMMFKKYAGSFSEFDRAKEEYEGLRDQEEKKKSKKESETLISLKKVWEEVQKKHASIKAELDTGYYQKLEIIKKDYDWYIKKIERDIKKAIKEDYYEKYAKYKEKRPEAVEITLDYAIWSLIPGVKDNLPLVEKIIDINSLLYKLSTVYVDAFFNQTEEKVFLLELQSKWDIEYKKLKENGADLEEIRMKQNAFMSFEHDEELQKKYNQIIQAKLKARDEYQQELSEVGGMAFVLALKSLLDPKQLKEVSRPDTITLLVFTKMLKNETQKVGNIFGMLLNTIKGNSFVIGQTSASAILSVSASLKQNKNERTIVNIREGKRVYQLIRKDGKIESMRIHGGSAIKRKSDQKGNSEIVQATMKSSMDANLKDITKPMTAKISQDIDINFGNSEEESETTKG